MAIHTLRDGCSDSQKLSFLAEALTLGQFDHSHVVRLEGVVTRGRAQCRTSTGVGMTGQEGGVPVPPGPSSAMREPPAAQCGEKASAFFHWFRMAPLTLDKLSNLW